jgi:hypothetical protein
MVILCVPHICTTHTCSVKSDVGEYLTIIQHPSGERKQVVVRENKLLKFDGDVLWYATDTVGGSSGSPVFNRFWQVVALHHRGVPKKDSKGRWLRRDGRVCRGIPSTRMPEFDTIAVRDALRRLRFAAPEVFGAIGHRFTLNEPLVETAVLAFERQHAIRLPVEYRRFLLELGNGGAGPYYGVHPLGAMDGTFSNVEPWGDLVGPLAASFAFREPWNDLTGRPDDALADSDEQEYERRMNAFEQRYWHSSVMSGAFPICHKGCALRIWLVVSGDEAGNLWDDRAEYSGVAPVLLRGGSRATFGAWYREWLDQALQVIRT